jgi:hypothetical protein
LSADTQYEQNRVDSSGENNIDDGLDGWVELMGGATTARGGSGLRINNGEYSLIYKEDI